MVMLDIASMIISSSILLPGTSTAFSCHQKIKNQYSNTGKFQAFFGPYAGVNQSLRRMTSASSAKSSGSSTFDIADDPLGPPPMIRDLPTNKRNVNIQIERPYFDPSFEDFSIPQQHSYTINRIAQNSDVFLLKGFLTEWECEAIMDEAKHHYEGGMTMAMSQDDRSSETRTKCNVAWLGDSRLGGICGMIGEAIEDTFLSGQAKDAPLSKRSDLQVLNYKHGGKFVLHHDDHDRMLTVITYLNGVGETWMPLVDVVGNDDKNKEQQNDVQEEEIQCGCLAEAIQEVKNSDLSPGSAGILVSGSIRDCSKDLQEMEQSGEQNITKNPHIVSVDQGDAIAFYSYRGNEGKKDWRSIHAGMPLKFEGEEGKWIATSWYHAPSLTANSS